VVTLVEHGPCTRARMKNRWVAARSRFGDISTSMTWPSWSIARYRHPPTSDFHIRLIHEPTITGGADTGQDGVDGHCCVDGSPRLGRKFNTGTRVDPMVIMLAVRW
jgi:hypothetical protein